MPLHGMYKYANNELNQVQVRIHAVPAREGQHHTSDHHDARCRSTLVGEGTHPSKSVMIHPMRALWSNGEGNGRALRAVTAADSAHDESAAGAACTNAVGGRAALGLFLHLCGHVGSSAPGRAGAAVTRAEPS